MAGAGLTHWHLITCEYPPQPGGVSDYSAQVAEGLRAAGEDVRVWCREFQGFSAAGIRAVSALLDSSPEPKRLLLQWVPHGYGRRSMNLEFCRWIARRGEELDLMVHEAGLGFGEGGLLHHAAAAVHRLMLAILLRRARKVYTSAQAWERYLGPYRFGRRIPIEWLPVPGNIPVSPNGPDADYPVGYFGQYDAHGLRVLRMLLDRIPDRIALIGRGADRVPLHERTVVIGEAHPERISRAIASSRVMLHHYIDGVSGRRTTAMASLAHGKAVVTVEGRLTEPLWRESGAVALARVGDSEEIASAILNLLGDPKLRQELGASACRLYRERFCLERTIQRLLV